jgi:hypothetical protein
MPAAKHSSAPSLAPEAKNFYCTTLEVFRQAGVEVLVGGAYAVARFTGIERHTKDLDIFVRASDFSRALEVQEQAGFATEATYPHWLGKASCGEYFIDVIFSSGNGMARVDEEWFIRSIEDRVFDVPVRLCPPEEMLWVKAFIQERERFDGADVAHLLYTSAERLNWPHLLHRFGANWRVLLSHLVLFGFIYPSEAHRVPRWVMHELMRRLEVSSCSPAPADRLCRGTLLSRQQYLVDTERWGLVDVRRLADNPMTDDQIAAWTGGIARDGSPEGDLR